MTSLQELSVRQISDAIAAAVCRTIPITVTVQSDGVWQNYASRAIRVSGPHLLVELPGVQACLAPHEFVPAEKVGVSFKLKHHKHLFTAVVAGLADHTLEEGSTIKVLALCLPTRMQRLQRRVYYRADVPANRIVRASFWLGGRATEPADGNPALPVWSGKVTNLSAGGFQMTLSEDPVTPMEVGDAVGVRLAFGVGEQVVYADAQFRHLQHAEGQTVMGFQFIGLGQSAEGRDALKVISAKVCEFQNLAEHSSNSRRDE